MKKLKSLSVFMDENPGLVQVSSLEINGGITQDTIKYICSDTMTEWNCADQRLTTTGDGMYGDGIIWEEQP